MVSFSGETLTIFGVGCMNTELRDTRATKATPHALSFI